jgi:hypothetical protein
MYISMQYGHWGITVSKRHDEKDYAPIVPSFSPTQLSTEGVRWTALRLKLRL